MLAIVIPYFKKFFFEETLISLANQTDKRFVVYIGDDASEENPKDLLEKMIGKFVFYYQKFDENLGSKSLTKHWDRCLLMTKNEPWLMVLGDDDVLGSNVVSSFYENLQKVVSKKINVIRFSSLVFDTVNNSKSTVYRHPELEKSPEFLFRRFSNQTRSSLSEYIFNRESYKNCGFYQYPLGWHADDRAWLCFSKFDFIFSINNAVIEIGLSDKNLSRGFFKINEKQTASLAFFEGYIFKNQKHFTKEQLNLFYKIFEKLLYDTNKINFEYFFKLIFWWSMNKNYIESIRFSRRCFIQYVKKW